MQGPPHQLHRVALRRPRGQRMQTDATPAILHIFLYSFADVAAVVVNGQVQLLMTVVGSPELVEQLDEKLAVPTPSRDPMEAPRLEAQRPADPHLAIGAWGAKGPLFTSAHPTEAHLGIRLQLGFVLEKRAGLLRHLQDVFEPGVLALDLLLGAFLGPDGARPPPAVLQPVQRAAKCLAARGGEPLSHKLQAEELATPARAQPAMLDGRVLFEQFLDMLVGLLAEQRHGAAPLAVVEGRPPFPEKASDDRVDGGARAEEDTGDLGGREPFGGEQRNVHPQPSTRFHFALHLGDEALAFLGDNGDILHVRPFLWWLDGFGVFTMPQRTAVCSIILGIYLVHYEHANLYIRNLLISTQISKPRTQAV